MDIETAPHASAASVQHVRLSGVASPGDAPRLSETLHFLIRRVSPRILVDIRHIAPPSPEMTLLLREMGEQARAHGGELVLCGSLCGEAADAVADSELPIHPDEADALVALGVDASPSVHASSRLVPDGVGEGGEVRRSLRQTLSMEFADASVRFSRARTTCVVTTPMPEERRHGVETEALGRTVILPRMLPRVDGAAEAAGTGGVVPRTILAPGFEPIRMWVPAEGAYADCILQALSVVRDLMGMESDRAERLATALEAVFGVACVLCDPSDSVGVEFAWKGRILCATLVVPQRPFALYEHLRPSRAPSVQDETSARRWLESLLGFVEIKGEGGDTHLLLAPLDTADESVILPPS